MQEEIEIEINLKMFKAIVHFEMHEGAVSYINALFVIIDGLHWNLHFLIEELKESIVEDILDNLKAKT
ncbi:MAG: hypothetical protein JKY51_05800 [Opitutaceae bacterium]|nr:hypothetical protein [Opitutaceae bacterium]